VLNKLTFTILVHFHIKLTRRNFFISKAIEEKTPIRLYMNIRRHKKHLKMKDKNKKVGCHLAQKIILSIILSSIAVRNTDNNYL
jgi:hypothetical protein